jgi:hypothetical protein
MRGNAFIDYTQLGLPFKLYTCEILFNKAICRTKNYDSLLLPAFHADMKQSQHFLKMLQPPSSHETYSRITSCIKAITVNQVKSFNVFRIPDDIYFTPPEGLTNAVKTVKPIVQNTRRVVMASSLLSLEDALYSGFSGTKLKVHKNPVILFVSLMK